MGFTWNANPAIATSSRRARRGHASANSRTPSVEPSDSASIISVDDVVMPMKTACKNEFIPKIKDRMTVEVRQYCSNAPSVAFTIVHNQTNTSVLVKAPFASDDNIKVPRTTKYTYKDLPMANQTKGNFVSLFLPTLYFHVGALLNPWKIDNELQAIIGNIWEAVFPNTSISGHEKVVMDLVRQRLCEYRGKFSNLAEQVVTDTFKSLMYEPPLTKERIAAIVAEALSTDDDGIPNFIWAEYPSAILDSGTVSNIL